MKTEIEYNPTYYAIIPANVRYDSELPANAKLLYGEITVLTNIHGVCWARNNYFAKLYKTSSVTVSRWINLLKEKRYIHVEFTYKKDSKEIDKRLIYVETPIIKNVNTPLNKNVNTPIIKNVKGNITRNINNTSNIVTKVTIGGKGFPLKELQIKYNGILTRTLKSIGGFTTNINKDTKLMHSVYKYLYELQHKAFLPGKELNSPILKDINFTRINRIMTDQQLENILKKAARAWRQLWENSDLWKPDVKTKKISMDKWFFNDFSTKGMSWFLYCAGCELREVKESLEEKKLGTAKKSLEKIDPEINKHIEKLYNNSVIGKWDNSEKLIFYYTVCDLLRWWLENKITLSKNNEGWVTHFRNPGKLLSTVGTFLEDCFPNPNPRFLIVDGWNWRQFSSWALGSLGVDLQKTK